MCSIHVLNSPNFFVHLFEKKLARLFVVTLLIVAKIARMFLGLLFCPIENYKSSIVQCCQGGMFFCCNFCSATTMVKIGFEMSKMWRGKFLFKLQKEMRYISQRKNENFS